MKADFIDAALHTVLGREKIPGFEGRYWIDRSGNVFNGAGRKILQRKHYGGTSRRSYSTKEYRRVDLYLNGKKQSHLVHRLVALTFHDRRRRPYVHHKDGDGTNNHADNLRWVTPFENHPAHHDTGAADF